MLRLSRAEFAKLIGLRANLGFIVSLIVLPAITAFLATAMKSQDAAIGKPQLDAVLLATVPMMLIQLFFGVNLARSEGDSGVMDSALLIEPKRWKVWFAKTLSLLGVAAVSAIFGQILVWIVLAGHLSNLPTSIIGLIVEESVGLVAIQVVGVNLGVAVARALRDGVFGPIFIVAAFWLGPQFLTAALTATTRVSWNPADVLPIELAQRIVWRGPASPVGFAGLGMSPLSWGEAASVFSIWFGCAVLFIVFAGRRSTRIRLPKFGWKPAQVRPPVVARNKREPENRLMAALRPIRREAYFGAVGRGSTIFMVVLAAIIMLSVLTAGSQAAGVYATTLEQVGDKAFASLDAQSLGVFGFGATPALAIAFYLAISQGRDAVSGEMGLVSTQTGNRLAIWLARLFGRFAVLSAISLAAYAVAVLMVFASGNVGTFEGASSWRLLLEASLKLLALVLFGVSFGLGCGFLLARPFGALMTGVGLLLLLPGLLMTVLLSTNNAAAAQTIVQFLPYQGLAVQHWDPANSAVYGVDQVILLNPDQRLLVSAAWALGLAALGLWRFMRSPIK